jgi:hypothetical protein
MSAGLWYPQDHEDIGASITAAAIASAHVPRLRQQAGSDRCNLPSARSLCRRGGASQGLERTIRSTAQPSGVYQIGEV